MISVGVLYSLYRKLPSFQIFYKLKSSNSVLDILSTLEDQGYFKLEESYKSTPFLAIKKLEDQFIEKFKTAVSGDRFFSTLINLKLKMPKIRLILREAVITNKKLSEVSSALKSETADFKALGKLLEEYISEKNNIFLKIAELEKDIDNIQLKILEKSVSMGKSNYKKYINILKIRFEEDSKLRSFYGINIKAEKNIDKTEKFKKLSEMECRFVNKATTDISEELIALQCFVTFSYLFYNARVVASVSPSERDSILVNYNIS